MSSKTILITGANSGIGREVFIKSLKKSYFVIAAVRNPIDFVNEITSLGIDKKKFIAIQLHLDSQDSVDSFAKRLKEVNKSLDFLVLNAGYIETAPVLMTSFESLKNHMNINFYSQINLIQSLTKAYFIKKRAGSIVAVSSSAAIDANPGRLAYASSKAALSTALRVFSKELGKINVRCNIVAPGLTNTKLMKNSTEQKQIEDFINTLSIKRVGNPEEIANTILFLCEEESSFITGQIICVDGGIR